MRERVQKLLAAAGHGSRRQCEELIRQGRVRVNGGVATLGQKADPARDTILLDGKPWGAPEPLVYLVLNKPAGVLSSARAQGGNSTVLDWVEVDARVFPVGRLDLESEGLILLTNDGELTHRLTHPRFEHEKEYRVRLDRRPTQAQLDSWRQGVDLPGLGRTASCRVEQEEPGSRWLRVVMHEGRKRQIRELAAHFGLRVERLIRVRLGSLKLGELAPGGWRRLALTEIGVLRQEAGLPPAEEVG